MNVIFMLTRYSVIFPPSIRSFCSWIQAPFTFWSVLFARSMPIRVASSKLLADEAVISVTRATAMEWLLLTQGRGCCIGGDRESIAPTLGPRREPAAISVGLRKHVYAAVACKVAACYTSSSPQRQIHPR